HLLMQSCHSIHLNRCSQPSRPFSSSTATKQVLFPLATTPYFQSIRNSRPIETSQTVNYFDARSCPKPGTAYQSSLSSCSSSAFRFRIFSSLSLGIFIL